MRVHVGDEHGERLGAAEDAGQEKDCSVLQDRDFAGCSQKTPNGLSAPLSPLSSPLSLCVTSASASSWDTRTSDSH